MFCGQASKQTKKTCPAEFFRLESKYIWKPLPKHDPDTKRSLI